MPIDENDPHTPPSLQVALEGAEIDQMVAGFKEEIIKIVRLIREHEVGCEAPACPGRDALEHILEIVQAGPSFALTAMAMSMFYLAQTDFGKHDRLEEMLNAKLEEGGLLGHQGQEGGSEPDPS